MKSENHPSGLKKYIQANFDAISSKQTKTQTGDVCVKQTLKPGARKEMDNVRVRLAAFFPAGETNVVSPIVGVAEG